MDDILFIGTTKAIEIDAILRKAAIHLAILGVQLSASDLVAVRIEPGKEERLDHGQIGDKVSLTKLLYRGSDSYVSIVASGNEVVPGYTVITTPLIIGVSVWVGADMASRTIAACVAAAIADIVGGVARSTNNSN